MSYLLPDGRPPDPQTLASRNHYKKQEIQKLSVDTVSYILYCIKQMINLRRSHDYML